MSAPGPRPQPAPISAPRPTRQGLAIAAVSLFLLVAAVNTGANLPLSLLTNGVPSAMIALFLLHRFGLFTFVAADLVHGLLSAYPMTTVSKLWFAQGGYFAIVTVALVGVIGFLLIRADRNAVATSSGVE